MSKVKKSVSVTAPVDLVYRAWHNFENFPAFMSNIEEVRVVGRGRSHWRAKGPLDTAPEWDAEITLDQPNEAIGWRSIRGSSGITTAGRVNFRGDEHTTEVDVTIEYEAPGGVAGDAIAHVFANPERQVEEDLARFKDVIEQGQRLAGLRSASATPGEEPLGGSMGGVSARELDDIASTNSGVSPAAIDDPATRDGAGGRSAAR